jgi:hypothetical protein
LSDIIPGTRSANSLSSTFLRVPGQGQRFSHYLEIDVSGLEVVEGRPAILERIAASPALGQRVEQRGGNVWVRRWLMPKRRNHVYYAIEATEIVVLTIWGAPRRRGPKL